jgi:peptidoglycan hydrolase CwlO-like protein
MVHHSSSPEPSQPNESSEDQEFLDALQEAQKTLNGIRDRYHQVTEATEKRSELRAQYNRTQGELRRHRTKELQQELKQLKTKLSELEIVFESRLVDPFWMAIRFGGLGLVIGWVLRALMAR